MTARIETLRSTRATPRPLDLTPVVDALRHSRDVTHNIRLAGKVTEVPSAAVIAEILESIVTALFPTHLGPHGLNHEGVDIFVRNLLSTSLSRLGDQIARGLQFDTPVSRLRQAQHDSDQIIHGFTHKLPAIRALLVSDLKAALRHESSVETLSEVLICYPSFRAIIHYRLAHALHELGARFVARVMASLAQATTGIDIHPAAKIGQEFFIGRGVGIAIGETAVLGENVRLHQGVTLGESGEPTGLTLPRRIQRHPIVENNVVIHAGATILGRIIIGAGSIIGGNVWLTRNVPPGSTILQADHTVGTVLNLD